MTRVLITAFEPYGDWQTNASWLVLMELTRDLPERPDVTTRLYPVDFAAVRTKLEEDLTADFDFAIHLGQAPGQAYMALESIAINLGGEPETPREEYKSLVPDGPTALQTSLPLGKWATDLREEGIPARVSYHAGTYLCNASYYFSQYLAKASGLKTKSLFLHLPIDLSQATGLHQSLAALPRELSARGLRRILEMLAD